MKSPYNFKSKPISDSYLFRTLSVPFSRYHIQARDEGHDRPKNDISLKNTVEKTRHAFSLVSWDLYLKNKVPIYIPTWFVLCIELIVIITKQKYLKNIYYWKGTRV